MTYHFIATHTHRYKVNNSFKFNIYSTMSKGYITYEEMLKNAYDYKWRHDACVNLRDESKEGSAYTYINTDEQFNNHIKTMNVIDLKEFERIKEVIRGEVV